MTHKCTLIQSLIKYSMRVSVFCAQIWFNPISSTERYCFFYTLVAKDHHIIQIMWSSFCLDHQTQSFDFPAVFDAGSHDIDTGSVDAAVA